MHTVPPASARGRSPGRHIAAPLVLAACGDKTVAAETFGSRGPTRRGEVCDESNGLVEQAGRALR
jgi:hypothetical protein